MELCKGVPEAGLPALLIAAASAVVARATNTKRVFLKFMQSESKWSHLCQMLTKLGGCEGEEAYMDAQEEL